MATTPLLIIILVLLIILVFLSWFQRTNRSDETTRLQMIAEKLQAQVREDARLQRADTERISSSNRQELNQSLRDLKNELADQFKGVRQELEQFREAANRQQDKLAGSTEERLTLLADRSQASQQSLREAYLQFAGRIEDTLIQRMQEFGRQQLEKFAQLDQRQQQLLSSTEKKLEEMRQTVDEKLHNTLQERLGQSFALVGKQLESVQKGLGEMQTIAADVGGLKKVLSNVKLRGTVGEIQLAMLLEQLLAPGQYEANVCTKMHSTDPVEFAIKLPGRSEDPAQFVYLPIDAKFPKDAYEHLLTAYENGGPEEVEAARKNLEQTIRRMAKDIRDKYIDPPNTTDFAILFLPFESIYAEVIRRNALMDQLRQDYNITIAGPTTLAALLNSLQMGFRTLALQQRSSEVWKTLGAVKTEFEKFGGLLEKAKKNIQTGLGQLEDVSGKRTRAINRQLKEIESLPAAEQLNTLPDPDIPDWPEQEEE